MCAQAAVDMLLKLKGLKPSPVKVILVKGNKGLWAEEDPVVMNVTVGDAGMKHSLASAARLTSPSGAPLVTILWPLTLCSRSWVSLVLSHPDHPSTGSHHVARIVLLGSGAA